MHSLSARQLLSVWKQGMAQSPVDRALALLSASGAGDTADLQRLPIGHRDALLLKLRQRTFGSDIECVTACPLCSEQVELHVRVQDLLIEAPELPLGRAELKMRERSLEFRLPDSLDLAAAAEHSTIEEARQTLLGRCLTAPAELTDDEARAVADEMARLDPQGDVQLELKCPSCRHAWKAGFDILPIFWGELNAWAERLLREVHELAREYGWSEADILGMSAWRRQLYLNMVVA